MRTIRPLPPDRDRDADRCLRRRVVRRARPGRRSAPSPAAGRPSAAGPKAPQPANPAPANGLGGGQIAAVDDAKIIRTGTIVARGQRCRRNALRVARDAIVGLGGYVGASTTSNDGDQPSAEITYRIPADRGRRHSTPCAASTA